MQRATGKRRTPEGLQPPGSPEYTTDQTGIPAMSNLYLCAISEIRVHSPSSLPSFSPFSQNRQSGERRISPFSTPKTSVTSSTFLLLSRRRPKWMMRSIPAASCPRTAASGNSTSDIRHMVSSLESMSRALFACPVDKLPSWPVFAS